MTGSLLSHHHGSATSFTPGPNAGRPVLWSDARRWYAGTLCTVLPLAQNFQKPLEDKGRGRTVAYAIAPPFLLLVNDEGCMGRCGHC
jgi:hypothetical protein